jgi:hypothetical protein
MSEPVELMARFRVELSTRPCGPLAFRFQTRDARRFPQKREAEDGTQSIRPG